MQGRRSNLYCDGVLKGKKLLPSGRVLSAKDSRFDIISPMSRLNLYRFFNTAPGMLLHRWEAGVMDKLMPELSGGAALQVGGPWAKTLRGSHHDFKAALSAGARELELSRYSVNALGLPQALPFDGECFDAVVLFHVLEFEKEPEAVLSEAGRVLKPEGRLIIAGINPWGPWWRRRHKKLLGADCSPVSTRSLKGMIGGAYRVSYASFGVYCPSLSNDPNTLARWSWTDRAGDRWWPAFSNAYILCGVKKVLKPTLVGKISPVFDSEPSVSPGAVCGAQMSGSERA